MVDCVDFVRLLNSRSPYITSCLFRYLFVFSLMRLRFLAFRLSDVRSFRLFVCSRAQFRAIVVVVGVAVAFLFSVLDEAACWTIVVFLFALYYYYMFWLYVLFVFIVIKCVCMCTHTLLMLTCVSWFVADVRLTICIVAVYYCVNCCYYCNCCSTSAALLSSAFYLFISLVCETTTADGWLFTDMITAFYSYCCCFCFFLRLLLHNIILFNVVVVDFHYYR